MLAAYPTPQDRHAALAALPTEDRLDVGHFEAARRKGDQSAPQRGRASPGRGLREVGVGLLPRLLQGDQVLGEAER